MIVDPNPPVPVQTSAGAPFLKRVERDPVGFSSVVRLFLAMALAIGLFLGWEPDLDAYTLMTGAVLAFVEASLLWWTKGLVTPDVKIAERDEIVETVRQRTAEEIAGLDPEV